MMHAACLNNDYLRELHVAPAMIDIAKSWGQPGLVTLDLVVHLVTVHTQPLYAPSTLRQQLKMVAFATLPRSETFQSNAS